jgi:hypothetical protein
MVFLQYWHIHDQHRWAEALQLIINLLVVDSITTRFFVHPNEPHRKIHLSRKEKT